MKLRVVGLAVILSGMSLFSHGQIKLTIEQALDIAEENNPQMKTAKLNFERTQLMLEAQRAALKPQFSMTLDPFSYSQSRSFDNRFSEWYTNKSMSSGGVFRSELPILWTDGSLSLINRFNWQNSESMNQNGTNYNKAFTNTLSLQYDQPIFTYNRLKMTIKNLEFDHENSKISYALQRLRTEQNITGQFYRVYMAQNNLDISKAEYENVKKNYDIIKDKVEAEMSAREELLQAEINLANSESSVETRDVTLKNAKDALKQTLGMSLNEDIEVLADIKVVPILVNPEKAIQCGLSSRMELRQREISIEQADMAMISEKARNEFKGDIRLSLGIAGDNEQLGQIYTNPTQSPRVSISFNVPIFDWGQKKARIQAQKTAQTVAQLNYENEKISIELDVRQTIRSLENLRSQISIQEKTVRNSQNTYELNEIRYREGDLTGMQMSLFQTQLSNAQSSLVSAKINYMTELLNLKIITLYDYEKDKPIVPMQELSFMTTR